MQIRFGLVIDMKNRAKNRRLKKKQTKIQQNENYCIHDQSKRLKNLFGIAKITYKEIVFYFQKCHLLKGYFAVFENSAF